LSEAALKTLWGLYIKRTLYHWEKLSAEAQEELRRAGVERPE
jgi:hypothetical protein